MARRSNLTIDEKIDKAQEQVVKTKTRYDEAVAALEDLMAKKKAMQNEELLRLFAGSSKSYEEVVNFLSDGMNEAQLSNVTQKKYGRKPKSRV